MHWWGVFLYRPPIITALLHRKPAFSWISCDSCIAMDSKEEQHCSLAHKHLYFWQCPLPQILAHQNGFCQLFSLKICILLCYFPFLLIFFTHCHYLKDVCVCVCVCVCKTFIHNRQQLITVVYYFNFCMSNINPLALELDV